MNKIKESMICRGLNSVHIDKGLMYRTDGALHYYAKGMLPAGTYPSSSLKFTQSYALSSTKQVEPISPPSFNLGPPIYTGKIRVPTVRGSALNWFFDARISNDNVFKNLFVFDGKAYMSSSISGVITTCDLPDCVIPYDAYQYVARHLVDPYVTAHVYEKHIKLEVGSHSVVFQRSYVPAISVFRAYARAFRTPISASIEFDPRVVAAFCDKVDAVKFEKHEGEKPLGVHVDCDSTGKVSLSYGSLVNLISGKSATPFTAKCNYMLLRDAVALSPKQDLRDACMTAELGYGSSLIMLMKRN